MSTAKVLVDRNVDDETNVYSNIMKVHFVALSLLLAASFMQTVCCIATLVVQLAGRLVNKV